MRDDFLKLRKVEDNFIEQITRDNPEWVKSSRLEYLHQEVVNEVKSSRQSLNVILGCEIKERWFAELIQRGHLDPIFKRITRLSEEIKAWKIISHEDNGITDEDIETANQVDCKDFLEIARIIFNISVQTFNRKTQFFDFIFWNFFNDFFCFFVVV